MSDTTATTGEVVRTRREELGLTKAELARRASLTRSSIHEIEADQRSHLQARTLQALERALELSPGTIQRRTRPSVFVSHSGGDSALAHSLRRELEGRREEARFETVFELLMRVADRVDELESRLANDEALLSRPA